MADRLCEGCGMKMLPWSPRTRGKDGKMICTNCAEGRPGRPRAQASVVTASGDGDFMRTLDAIKPGLGQLWLDAEWGESDGSPYDEAVAALTQAERDQIDAADRARNNALWGRTSMAVHAWGTGVGGGVRQGDDPSALSDDDLEEAMRHGSFDDAEALTAWVNEAMRRGLSLHGRDDQLAERAGVDRQTWYEQNFARHGVRVVADDASMRETCPGSDTMTGGFPGDDDVCPVCQKYVRVNAEGYLRKHQRTVKSSALSVIAHDSGDGETIYHCPFCGAGQVVARSDGTTECQFCHTMFTVQVQPEHPGHPQTVNGQPVQVPGMPGDPTNPSTPPGAEGGADDMDAAFQPPGMPPAFQPPDQPMPPNDKPTLTAAKHKSLPHPSHLDDGELLSHLRDDHKVEFHNGLPSRHTMTRRHNDAHTLTHTPGHLHDAEHITAAALYLVPEGVVIPESSYIRRLALEHADDRAAMLIELRASR